MLVARSAESPGVYAIDNQRMVKAGEKVIWLSQHYMHHSLFAPNRHLDNCHHCIAPRLDSMELFFREILWTSSSRRSCTADRDHFSASTFHLLSQLPTQ